MAWQCGDCLHYNEPHHKSCAECGYVLDLPPDVVKEWTAGEIVAKLDWLRNKVNALAVTTHAQSDRLAMANGRIQAAIDSLQSYANLAAIARNRG